MIVNRKQAKKDRGKILLVDDQSVARCIYGKALEHAGFQVIKAVDYDSAINLFDDSIDLALVDIVLEGKSGLEILAYIHKQQPQCPVIMVSAHANKNNAINALHKGAADYIEKPANLQELTSVVERWISYRTLQEENICLHDEQKLLYELQKSELRFHNLIEAVPDGVLICCENRIVYANTAAANILKALGADELVGRELLDLVSSGNRKSIAECVKYSLQKQTPLLRLEVKLQQPGGESFDAELSITCTDYLDKAAVQLMFHDITQRKQTEKALSQSEESLRNLVEADINALVVHKDFCFVYANPAARKLFEVSDGITVPDVSILDYVHPDYRSSIRLGVRRIQRKNSSLESASILIITPNGQQRNIEITSTPITFEHQQAVLSIIRDVTEQRRAEEKIRTLSSSVEQACEAIVITDKRGTIEYINPAFTHITGYSKAEVIGQNTSLLKSGEHNKHFYEEMREKLRSGHAWQGRIIDKKKDGSLYPTLLTISPVLDGSGGIGHFVGIQQDLTAYEEMEEKFHQAQKMEAVGTLVGGIAHDFNNILAGITGNMYLAKSKVSALPNVVHKLDNIEKLAFRAADMIKQLLAFARKDKLYLKAMSFTSYVKEIIGLVRVSVPENIKLNQFVCHENLQVYGDSTQLHQVVLNLVSNARDALEDADNPAIMIRLEPFTADAAFINKYADSKSRFFARLSVGDNGCGIPQEDIEHVFEPFFTSKEQGKGTGLGLAMVYGAMQTHNAILEVESEKGSGTVFHIYIPLIVQQGQIADSEQLKVLEGRGETIMLVDDEQHIVETGVEVLENIGYQVLTAANGSEAVDLYKARSGEIDLIIIDAVMPVMGGVEAVSYIRKTNPRVRVLYSTGYDKNTTLPQGPGVLDAMVLSKPFSTAVLSHAVREMLDS